HSAIFHRRLCIWHRRTGVALRCRGRICVRNNRRGRELHTYLEKERMPASQTLTFARQFVKNPKLVASVVPSSPFLVNHLMSLIDWKRTRVLVEYGPGLGTITEEVLKRMRPDAVLVAIELNQE